VKISRLRIVYLVIRRTYGFNKKSDAISLSQFMKCSGSKPATITALKNLLRLNILKRENRPCQGFEYSFNKYHEEWLKEAFETRRPHQSDNLNKITGKADETSQPDATSKADDYLTSKDDDYQLVKLMDTGTSKADETTLKDNIKDINKDNIKNNVVIPKELDFPIFKKTWDEWLVYRSQIRKKVSPITQQKQLNFLSAYPPDIAIAIIEKSITAGWIGLFEPKNLSPAKSAKNHSAFALTEEEAKQFINDHPR